jgi:hypothetical protein
VLIVKKHKEILTEVILSSLQNHILSVPDDLDYYREKGLKDKIDELANYVTAIRYIREKGFLRNNPDEPDSDQSITFNVVLDSIDDYFQAISDDIKNMDSTMLMLVAEVKRIEETMNRA